MVNKLKLKELLSNFNVQSATIFLVILLCADFIFFILHSVNSIIPSVYDPLYSLEVDKGYPEMFQYIKWFWIAILMVYLSRKNHSVVYLAWGIVFAYFLLDDALIIHEKVGFYFADNFEFTPPLGLRLNDVGELAASIIAGIFLGSIILMAYLKGNKVFRKMSHDLILLILCLVFFGIIVDLSIYLFNLKGKMMEVMGFIEDAGEMLITSLILWYIFFKSLNNKKNEVFFCDYFRIIPKRFM